MMTPPLVEPRYITPRNPERATDGPIVARFAQMLGFTLLPWQQRIFDVALEIDPDTGTYYYHEVLGSTQRQVGKTTAMDCYMHRNCFWGDNRNNLYLAQTGKDANDRFREFIQPYHKTPATPLTQFVQQIRLSNGSMKLIFKNGSSIAPGTITDSSGHGGKADLVVVDEVFALSEEKRKLLVDAYLPSMNTRRALTGVQPQMWWISTEGTQDSTAWNGMLDKARLGDISQRTCFFDYGIPLGSNPEDLENIWAHHPGAGHLFTFDDLKRFRDQFGDDIAGFARAYGNLRDTGIQDRIISAQTWQDTATNPVQPDALTDIVFGVAVQMGGLSTSIAACYTHPTSGKPCVQLVDTLNGTSNSAQAIKRLQERYNAPVFLDYRGPGAPLADILRTTTDSDGKKAYTLIDAPAREIINVAPIFVTALDEHNVLHATDSELDNAAQSVGARHISDSYVFQRNTTANIAPIEAAAFAYWGYMHKPAPELNPLDFIA